MRAVILVAVLCLVTGSAAADPTPAQPWYRGKAGHRRVVRLSIAGGLGLTYLASETVFKSRLAATDCRWCDPPAFDRVVRNALVWDDTSRANLLSNLDGYVLAPLVGLGLLIASDYDAGWARFIDDTVPVMETVAISQVFTQVVKFAVARQRPFVHFGDPARPHGNDDNMSFFSGHSALGFAITASAGMVCHWRHYRTEPYVWGAGIALSLSTEYLRVAADKHYISDVFVGGVVGLASGLLIPRLVWQDDLKIVPTGNGIAVAGTF